MRFSLKEFRDITQDFYLMLATLFFMKIGQFMLMPFLAIYLSRYSYASPSIIGVTIGVGSCVYAIAGVISGFFIDRFGAKKSMIFALFFSGIALNMFFFKHYISWFILINSLIGATRAFFDISTKTYRISELSIEQRKICLSLRFMVSNSAAAIGPIIGAYFAFTNSYFAFKITGIMHLTLGALAIFILRDFNQPVYSKKNAPFYGAMTILLQDSKLRILLLISTIILSVYSQIDSTLAQYLNTELSNGARVYSLLLIINAVICVTLQLMVSKATRNIDENIACTFAIILFIISYLIVAFFLNIPALIVAIIIMTLAEITVIPLNDLLLSRIAPPDQIGTYYGIAGAAMFGFSIGPIAGGFIYEYFNAKILFLICSIFCLLVLFLYKKLFHKISREQYLNEKNRCSSNNKHSDWNSARVV